MKTRKIIMDLGNLLLLFLQPECQAIIIIIIIIIIVIIITLRASMMRPLKRWSSRSGDIMIPSPSWHTCATTAEIRIKIKKTGCPDPDAFLYASSDSGFED
jgi:tryptophan-rich sensory protein